MLELVGNVQMGEELAFTRIKVLFVVLSSTMADFICSLIISVSSSADAYVFLGCLTDYNARTSSAHIELWSMPSVVIFHISLIITFMVSLLTRSGTTSVFVLS